MGLFAAAKNIVNGLLWHVNARVDSLTAERAECKRLQELESGGHFDKPIFPILPQFEVCDPSRIFEQIKHDQLRFAEIVDPGNANRFPLNNDYYTTPDAEVLYAIVQLYRPANIIEVGSGYSTQLFRRAINDAGLTTKLTSIDPDPRKEIAQQSDVIISERVERIVDRDVFGELQCNDILFIDSSHISKTGNDVNWLLLSIVPRLPKGVLLHFHDIFLPFEYPVEWVIGERWEWSEQYLIQALLTGSNSFEVLWPGYYLQKTHANFQNAFPFWAKSTARSLWLRRA